MVARWGPVVIWMGVIFMASQQSDLPSLGFSLPDKAWHAAFYAVLGALLWWALRPAGTDGSLIRALTAIGIGSAYGYADEVHQWFVPGRTYDPTDWAFDVIGVIAGVLLLALIARRRP